jgi:hypothetical protein
MKIVPAHKLEACHIESFKFSLNVSLTFSCCYSSAIRKLTWKCHVWPVFGPCVWTFVKSQSELGQSCILCLDHLQEVIESRSSVGIQLEIIKSRWSPSHVQELWRKIWRHRNFICENLIFAPECLFHLVTPLHSVNFKLATWTVIVFEWSDYMNQCKSTTLGVSGPLLTLNDSSIRRLCQAPALDNSLPCYTGLTWKHFWKM